MQSRRQSLLGESLTQQQPLITALSLLIASLSGLP
jgi:hypothetical protein